MSEPGTPAIAAADPGANRVIDRAGGRQTGDDPLRSLEQGAAEFNAGLFFECHDTLEDAWQGIRGPARDFFQGLIQVAVGFYHLDNANLKGARSQLEKGLEKLARYGDAYLGIELRDFRREVERWLAGVRAGHVAGGHVRDLPKLRTVTATRLSSPPE